MIESVRNFFRRLLGVAPCELVCVYEVATEEPAISRHDLFFAAAMCGLICHQKHVQKAPEEIIELAQEWADLMVE